MSLLSRVFESKAAKSKRVMAEQLAEEAEIQRAAAEIRARRLVAEAEAKRRADEIEATKARGLAERTKRRQAEAREREQEERRRAQQTKPAEQQPIEIRDRSYQLTNETKDPWMIEDAKVVAAISSKLMVELLAGDPGTTYLQAVVVLLANTIGDRSQFRSGGLSAAAERQLGSLYIYGDDSTWPAYLVTDKPLKNPPKGYHYSGHPDTRLYAMALCARFR